MLSGKWNKRNVREFDSRPKDKEVNNMATSTFVKEFWVSPTEEQSFVNEMTKKVTPTLSKDFKSNFSPVKDLQESLQKALK